MQSILDEHPDVLELDLDRDDTIDLIRSIKGFEKKTAEQFADNVDKLKKFIRDHPMITLRTTKKKKKVEKKDKKKKDHSPEVGEIIDR